MQIQSICETMGKSACLIFCDLYLAGIEPLKAIEKFNELVSNRVIKEDCYVLDHENLIYYFSGKKYRYIRTETPPKDELYIANYVYKNSNHFVVCRNGEVVFNSLDNSQCVKYGKPQDFRYLE